MKSKLIIVFILLPFFLFSQVNFNRFFRHSSLRFDFLLGGNKKNIIVYPEQIKHEPHWGGSKVNLVDYLNYGTFRFRVFDVKSDSLIFAKGFSTLFQEWQTTAEAKQSSRTFYQTAIFPYPKQEVRLEIDARQWEGDFKTIYSTLINPNNYFINSENQKSHEVKTIQNNGTPDKKVDIAILAEGYTSFEMDKFIVDATRLTKYLFEVTPFKERQNMFNVYAVKTTSEESGTDVPGENIYKNTYFNSAFYTFDVPRYLTTNDLKTIYDAASVVPYDQIYILVNTDRYGGGGFYNFVSVCSADNEHSNKVFVHEFGHGFAGLGDEYFNSTVAYEDYYNLDIEPWEPNLTTMVNFENKWKSIIHDSIPIPTPRKVKYRKIVGAFEGGGYMTKGIYSPMIDCRMRSNETEHFCPVCEKAIIEVIKYCTK